MIKKSGRPETLSEKRNRENAEKRKKERESREALRRAKLTRFNETNPPPAKEQSPIQTAAAVKSTSTDGQNRPITNQVKVDRRRFFGQPITPRSTMEFQTFLAQHGIDRFTSDKNIARNIKTRSFATGFRSYLRSIRLRPQDVRNAHSFIVDWNLEKTNASEGRTFEQFISEAITTKIKQGKKDFEDLDLDQVIAPEDGKSEGTQQDNESTGNNKVPGSNTNDPDTPADDTTPPPPQKGGQTNDQKRPDIYFNGHEKFDQWYKDYHHTDGRFVKVDDLTHHDGSPLADREIDELESELERKFMKDGSPLNPNITITPQRSWKTRIQEQTLEKSRATGEVLTSGYITAALTQHHAIEGTHQFVQESRRHRILLVNEYEIQIIATKQALETLGLSPPKVNYD